MHSQDGETDLKLLTKVLAPEQEVREVSLVLRQQHWEIGCLCRPPFPWRPGVGAKFGVLSE